MINILIFPKFVVIKDELIIIFIYEGILFVKALESKKKLF